MHSETPGQITFSYVFPGNQFGLERAHNPSLATFSLLRESLKRAAAPIPSCVRRVTVLDGRRLLSSKSTDYRLQRSGDTLSPSPQPGTKPQRKRNRRDCVLDGLIAGVHLCCEVGKSAGYERGKASCFLGRDMRSRNTGLPTPKTEHNKARLSVPGSSQGGTITVSDELSTLLWKPVYLAHSSNSLG